MDYKTGMRILCPPPALWTCGETYASIRRLDGGAVPSDSDLQAAFASYVPPKSWQTADFLARFTDAEMAAVVASEDVHVRVMRFKFDAHPTVESDNAELIAGLNYLVSIGILTADRPAALLS